MAKISSTLKLYLLKGIVRMLQPIPTAFKQARVTPLLKKPTLNTSLLENYRPVSLLPFVAKTLERELSSTSSHCFFHSTTNWMLNSQVSGVAIQQRLRYSQSLKPSPHSAGSFCCFWHCQSSDPPVHPLIAGHHWDSTSLVWILSHR